MGKTTNKWNAMVAIAPPTRMPRLAPISAISSLIKFDKIRKNTPIGAS